MTEFEKEIEPVVLWIKEKLKGRVPYSEELSISFCAALIKQHEKEALNIADVVGQSEQLAIQRCECEHCDPTEIKVCTNCDGYVE